MCLAFPEKSTEEITGIMQEFYKNFFDIFLETIKLLTISEKGIRRHMAYGDMTAVEKFRDQNRSVILAIGHFGNWELGAVGYSLQNYPNVRGVYKPISFKLFDNLMIHIRTRFGGGVYAMDETLKKMRENADRLTAIGFLADQNPSSHNAYWYHLLGRETPVFTSVELFARKFDFPVVYYRIVRLGRGKYEMNCEVLEEFPTQTEKHEITHKYIKLIEQDIIKDPANWLWTHNRWKRKKEDLVNR